MNGTGARRPNLPPIPMGGPRGVLPFVLFIAIAARLTALLLFPDIFAFSQPGAAIHGSVAYDDYARNLVATGVYGRVAGIPDSVLPPLYSIILALVYAVAGRSYIAVAALHIAFDLISIALLYAIGGRVFAGAGRQRSQRIGALAGLAFACYPYLIFQNLTLNDTALWIMLLHLFVWCMLRLRERDRFDRGTFVLGLFTGVVLGVSALARATLAPLAILLSLWFLFKLSPRQTLQRLAPVAAMSLIVLLPWLMRGAEVHGGFVAVSLNSGENLYQGNNAATLPIFRAGYDAQWSPRPARLPETDDALLNNRWLMDAGMNYLRDNRGQIPELLLTKLLVYWSPQITPLRNLRLGERLHVNESGELQIISGDESHIGVSAANAAYAEDGFFNSVARPLHLIYFGALLLLAVAGVWLSRRQWRMTSLPLFVLLSQTVVYLVFHPSTRYRSPTDPLLFLFSAVAVMWVWGRFQNWRKSHLRD